MSSRRTRGHQKGRPSADTHPARTNSYPPVGKQPAPSLYQTLCPAYRRPWPDICMEFMVKPSGEGSKLLELTDLLFTPPKTIEEAKKNRINLIHENPAMLKIPMFVKNGRKERGMSGTGCENPDCTYIEGTSGRSPSPTKSRSKSPDQSEDKHEYASIKRCGRCFQVVYCTAECQRADWPRHKFYCTSIDPQHSNKDGILRLARKVIPSPCGRVLLLAYCRDVLNADQDPLGAQKKNIVFSCTTIEDVPTPSSNSTQNPRKRKLLQISKVEIHPWDGPSDSSPPPDPRLGTWTRITFKSDSPGFNGSVTTRESLRKDVMWLMPRMPDPVVLLLHFNKIIRDDVDNKMCLRMP